jgi:hypothetical protein
MGQLISLIDQCDGLLRSDAEPRLGLVRAPLEYNFGRPHSGAHRRVREARAFVTVSSPFYPDLEAYFEALVEEWLISKGLVEGTSDM